jgi:hypothetical protein
MLNVTNKPFILSAVMLSVIMLNVTYKPFVLSVVMQSVVMLSVVLPAYMLAPCRSLHPRLTFQLKFLILLHSRVSQNYSTNYL